MVNVASFSLTIALPTAELVQMIKVGGTWAMTQTPQFNNFNTQPLDALAQQQSSQGQIASETEYVDTQGSFTPISASRFPNKKKLTRIVVIIILALCIAFYFIWHTPASTNSSPVITQQNFSGTSSNSSVNTSSPLTTSHVPVA
jgi:hypothetical protein